MATEQKITDLTAGTALVDADIIEVSQTVSTTPASKKFTWTLVKAFLKTYFDTLYPAETKSTIEAVLTGELTSHTHKEEFLKIMNLFGSAAIAFPVSRSNVLSSGTIVDNTGFFLGVNINKSQSITGVKTILHTQGNFTEDNFNGIGLYSVSGTTLTKVAESANDANYFKAVADTVVTIPFASPYSAAPGIYFIAFLYNRSAAVTPPELKLYTNAGITKLLYGLTNPVNFSIATQNTLATNYDISAASDSTAKLFHSWLY